MLTQKIAITVPPTFLKRAEQWVKKTGKSRSRHIVKELDNGLKTFEDGEITRIYNKAYTDRDSLAYNNNHASEFDFISVEKGCLTKKLFICENNPGGADPSICNVSAKYSTQTGPLEKRPW